MAEPVIDLSAISDDELAALLPKIENELEKRRETRRREALEKMREAAQAVGMTPEELLGLGASGGRRRRKGKRAVTMWQHPENSDLVYRGGKKPGWLKELEAAGKKPVKVADE
jgi:DNA-binding protein H-NS